MATFHMLGPEQFHLDTCNTPKFSSWHFADLQKRVLQARISPLKYDIARAKSTKVRLLALLSASLWESDTKKDCQNKINWFQCFIYVNACHNHMFCSIQLTRPSCTTALTASPRSTVSSPSWTSSRQKRWLTLLASGNFRWFCSTRRTAL